jgi:hypothetical protein
MCIKTKTNQYRIQPYVENWRYPQWPWYPSVFIINAWLDCERDRVCLLSDHPLRNCKLYWIVTTWNTAELYQFPQRIITSWKVLCKYEACGFVRTVLTFHRDFDHLCIRKVFIVKVSNFVNRFKWCFQELIVYCVCHVSRKLGLSQINV